MGVSRKIKALLKSDGPDTTDSENLSHRLKSRDKEIARLKSLLVKESEKSVRVENIVWIFGAGRTGSTWLAAMMDEIDGQSVWFEPRVGVVFDPGQFNQYKGKDFILSDHYKNVWLNSIRNFVLSGAEARFPEIGDDCLMVKEPAGSVGAQWLMDAMPESRIILLVRDPRDYAASWLDAHREGGWQNERRKKGSRQADVLADTDPDSFVKRLSRGYLRSVGNAKAAYDSHQGRKTLVRYEDLRADTLGTMTRLYKEVGVTVDAEQLARSVEKHAWESIPEEEKGEGKFYRKAKPGGWQDDLTPGQVEIVERITAPLLSELYPESSK